MLCFCLEPGLALEGGISGKVATDELWTARVAGARSGTMPDRAGDRTPARWPVLRHSALGNGPKRGGLCGGSDAEPAAVVIRMVSG